MAMALRVNTGFTTKGVNKRTRLGDPIETKMNKKKNSYLKAWNQPNLSSGRVTLLPTPLLASRFDLERGTNYRN